MGPSAVTALHPHRRALTGLVFALLAGLLLSLSLAAPARADVDDFSFESLDVEYQLGRAEDGTSTLTVVETFVAVFPEFDQNRGMRHILPDSFNGAPLNPQLVSITDENGAPRAAEAESEDGEYIMTSRSDDYVHGRQTYVFTYTLENVTRFYADTGADEFYWDVNGVDWAQPFGRITARVTMPAELWDARTGEQACYVGYQGDTRTCTIADVDGAVAASVEGVQPYQTMTIAIGFRPDTFTEFDTGYLASPWGWLQGGVALLGLGTALVLAGVTRRRHLRDAAGRPVIIAEYTPPRQIDALESAVLLGRTTKAIPAEVLEQAVVGSIRIEEGPPKLFGGTKLKAVLVDPSLADGDGRMLLPGLFPSGTPGEEFEFGRSDTRFSTTAQKVLKAASAELTSRGLRRPVPGGARAWPIVIAIVAAVLVVLFGIGALSAFVMPLVPILLIIGSVLVVLVVAGMVSHKPLTAEGAEVRDHLSGLKQFIEWAEADRIRMLQSPQGAERVPVDVSDPRVKLELYEKLLPYAVVFGQEKKWADELAVLYGDGRTPGWYAGSAGFNAAAFSAGISNLSTSASSSSSSGGSSGGGSAGGGGGGGGGGGV
ncbi:DUF2207 domain-containing protein [Microbacterium sp. M3]|uniref:DUF2207 domain-containing protein n=1 Tax=Microbacterium arthrosphaerae TaxID=792652 RepID=A0ABU4GXT5_9MICO|nr:MULTISPECIES: DUF2207 domain-containing protein [Microbacterium]MDW4571898.1 DUF2207 domain-containing protein [Microbacterium arthrosphaerae]MDW7605753.1 DUF2207 domain-containing protein [Microbacterium sp. M3]